jgi:CO/xanthine dehydrogenase Mo-binding subunit
MGVTAIGASVKRTEDIRFITGKGHYVDDVNRPGQAYAYFLRSPHAHATIDKIDTSAAISRRESSRSSQARTSQPTKSAASFAAG